MLRLLFFSLFLFCTSLHAFAQQNVWHKKLPFFAFKASFIELSIEDGQYFVSSERALMQVDKVGTATGYFKEPQFVFWTSVIKKQSATGGNPYFLIAQRTTSSTQQYTLFEYRPGIGSVNEKVIIDSLGSYTGKYPQIVPLNDSTFVVFGQKFFRKLKYSQSIGFEEEWIHPLNIQVEEVALHDNLFVVASSVGSIVALDENGDSVWSFHDTTLSFRSLKSVADGFIACGQKNGLNAVIAKLDKIGTKVWEKETDADEYHDIVSLPNGYAVTGESKTFHALLSITDNEGNLIWSKDLGAGVGGKVLHDPDGGFVVATRSPSQNVYLIKTDEQGNTGVPEDILLKNRRINTTTIQAILNPGSSFFYDGNIGGVTSLKDSNAAAIFVFSPWIAGLDEEEQLHLSADYYSIFSNSDYRPGHVDIPSKDFDRVWQVDKQSIELMRLDFEVDGILEQSIPFDLLTWPAKGNPNFRFNLDFSQVTTPSHLFPAPFVDKNNDGVYNVYDGDYPDIKGDQMAWWILTDSTEHEVSLGKPIGLDMSISAYTYDCAQNDLIDGTLFVDFEAINRFPTDYHDMYFGFYQDPDLGYVGDDYIGTIPETNTFYVYNSDAFDDNNLGFPAFGYNIPVQTTTFLDKALSHSTYFNNNILNPPPATRAPATPNETYNYLKGKWRDGNPVTYGGTGYNPGSLNDANHVFSDNPSDNLGWSMCNVSLPAYDRRMVSSYGPVNFAAGDTFQLKIAFTLHADIPHPCPDIFGLVKPNIEQVAQWKNEGILDAYVDFGQVVNLPPGQTVTLDATLPGASYLWSNGATSSSIDVSTPGNYAVSITATTGCQLVENVLVQLGTSVGVISQTPNWTVFPNPAEDFIAVNCPECSDDVIEVVLTDVQGLSRVFLERNRQFYFDVKNIPSGIYWLELKQNGLSAGMKKIVLIRK